MNRRSRMKSTLDSLFSSTKSQPQEPDTPENPSFPEKTEGGSGEKKPAKPVVNEKSTSAKASTPSVKTKPAGMKPANKPEKPAKAATPEKRLDNAFPMSPSVEKVTQLAPQVAETLVIPPEKAPEASINEDSPKSPIPSQPVETKTPAGAMEKAESQELLAEKTPDVTIPKKEELAESDEEEQLVVFLLANESFGISIQMVESIIKKQAITKVPHAEKFILGVTNLRGTVVPVVDLRRRFSMPVQEATKDTRIIVLNTDSGKNGIVVDEVVEVMRLPKKAIAPPPVIATTIHSSFIKGIARTENNLIILLDANSILLH